MEKTGQRSGLCTHRGDLPDLCTHGLSPHPRHGNANSTQPLLKHLVAMRELFLRMMRSVYYWRGGLTLHLFGVALMEWGVAVHVSAWPRTPLLSPFISWCTSHRIFTLYFWVHPCGTVCFYRHVQDFCARLYLYALACVVLCVCVLHVCGAPPSVKFHPPHRDNAIRRHHRNLI